MSQKGKNLSIEVDLIAFISLLSVLICSLLLTAVWIQIGTVDVKQAVGGQAIESGKKEPSVWVSWKGKGHLQLKVENAPRKLRSMRRIEFKPKKGGTADFVALGKTLNKLALKVKQNPSIMFKPRASTKYEEIITAMDTAKANGLDRLGVVPL